MTKLISELEAKRVVEKNSLENDGRVPLLRLTELGLFYQNKYVMKYHTEWAKNMSEVTDEQVKTAVQVIEKLRMAMPGGDDNES